MTVAMQVVQLIFHTVAIFFMLTLMFIGIWSFIIFLKMYKTQRIQSYLLEKINNSITALENNSINNSEAAFSFDNSNFEENKDNVIRIDEA